MMAAPKKTREKKSKKSETLAPGVGGKGPVNVDGFMHFSPYDLVRYELAQHKIANMLQAVGLKKAEIRDLQAQYSNKMLQLQNEEKYLSDQAKAFGEELRQLQAELQELYKIDLSQTTYDDVTGRIRVNNEPVTV